LGIAPEQRILLVNKSLIIQVILMTAIIMMLGLMITAKKGKIIIEGKGKQSNTRCK
jgi:hypothetical protein